MLLHPELAGSVAVEYAAAKATAGDTAKLVPMEQARSGSCEQHILQRPHGTHATQSQGMQVRVLCWRPITVCWGW